LAEESEAPILELLVKMTADSLEASTLDEEALMLVRLAALVAVDAPPASYLMNLGAARESGVDEEQVRGVLLAVAPIVGTARVATATSKIVQALGLALEIAELEEGETG
jgi:alkylhydroperoxidase/carboxymuconolactone decarboxylase family protein YurZ